MGKNWLKLKYIYKCFVRFDFIKMKIIFFIKKIFKKNKNNSKLEIYM